MTTWIFIILVNCVGGMQSKDHQQCQPLLLWLSLLLVFSTSMLFTWPIFHRFLTHFSQRKDGGKSLRQNQQEIGTTDFAPTHIFLTEHCYTRNWFLTNFLPSSQRFKAFCMASLTNQIELRTASTIIAKMDQNVFTLISGATVHLDDQTTLYVFSLRVFQFHDVGAISDTSKITE